MYDVLLSKLVQAPQAVTQQTLKKKREDKREASSNNEPNEKTFFMEHKSHLSSLFKSQDTGNGIGLPERPL